MAFLSLGTCFLVVTAATMAAVVAGASNQYVVGDQEGWRTPGDDTADLYQTWASKIRFRVGDSIVFQYRNDSVIRVDKRGYYHCNETGRGAFFKDGNTVFLLDKPGFYYFVSGDLEHCKKGQRLMIEVAGPPMSFPGSPSPSPLTSIAASSSVPSLLRLLVAAAACSLSLGFSLPSTLL